MDILHLTLQECGNKGLLEIVKDVSSLFLGAGALYVAYSGLTTWKKQARGLKEFDTAYNLRYAVLKVREAVKAVRDPAIRPSEDSRAKRQLQRENPERSFEQTYSHVYEARWEKIAQAQTEMDSHLLAAEILWDREIFDLIKPLKQKVEELSINLYRHFNPDLRGIDYERIDDVIYRNMDNTDAFSLEVQAVVDPILDYLKKKVS